MTRTRERISSDLNDRSSHHASLLVDLARKDFDSLLHLCGLGRHARRPHPKTVSGTEAFDRVRRMLPAMAAPIDPLKTLIDVRDGVVHSGLLPSADAHESLVAFLRASNEIYGVMGTDENERWGKHRQLVDALISESVTATEREVRRRIAAAKQDFADLLRRIPESEQGPVIVARQAEMTVSRQSDEELVETNCPACDEEATCAGTVEIDYEVDADIVDHEPVYNAWRIVTFYPRTLSCGACGLRLHDRGELRAAGVSESWEVEGMDIDDEWDRRG